MKAIYRPSVLRIAEISTRAMLALVICLIGLLSAPQTVQTARAASFDCNSVTDVPASECEALVALYNSTNGSGWKNSTNWLSSTTVDSWYGVSVNNQHVEAIQFFANNLSGSIPPELGNLSNLQTLYLYVNQLSGSIPPELGNLSNLQSLYLSDNQLSGSIPPQLGNLSNLLGLYLSENQLSGPIPPELGNLSNLEGIYLYENQLSGSIPPQLGNLSNLYDLYLYENHLSGSIPPELGNLSNLQYLYLYGNPLSGSVPISFTNLTKIEMFYFYNTALCEPASSAYLDWKSTVEFYQGTGISCSVSPKDDEKLTTSKVTFDWDDVPGATMYKLQLSTNEDFSSTIFSVKVTESTYPYLTSLLFNKTYYWRVKTLIDDYWTGWTFYKFYSMDPLAAPTLAEPGDGALLYPNITLSWSTLENAAQYKLQVARDSTFTDRVFNSKLADTFKDFNDLGPGKYYWRVKAIEEGGLKSPWSEVRMFTVTMIMPPDLWTPDPDATVSPDVTLTWQDKFDAVQYKVQVSKDALFTRLIVSEKTADPTKDLIGLNARSYYWRVKAIDADGFKSPWSEVWKFTVTTTP